MVKSVLRRAVFRRWHGGCTQEFIAAVTTCTRGARQYDDVMGVGAELLGKNEEDKGEQV